MINSVTVNGRLTKDPVIRYTPNGKPVTNFTLASARTYKDQQTGERQSDFIDCVVWGPQAEYIANKARKGKMLGVQGRLESRSYDGNDGKKVYVKEVNCAEVQILEWDDDQQQGAGQQGSYNQGQGSYNQQPGPYGNQGGYNQQPQGGYNNQQGGNNRGYSSNAPGSQQSVQNGQGQQWGGQGQKTQQRGPQDSPYNYMNNGQQPGSYGNQGGYNPSGRADGPPQDPFAQHGKPIDISDDDLPF